MTLAIAQAFDFATFFVMVRIHGVTAEANPLVQRMFLALGTPAIALSKIALVTLIVALAIVAFRRGPQARIQTDRQALLLRRTPGGRWIRSEGLHSIERPWGEHPSGMRPCALTW